MFLLLYLLFNCPHLLINVTGSFTSIITKWPLTMEFCSLVHVVTLSVQSSLLEEHFYTWDTFATQSITKILHLKLRLNYSLHLLKKKKKKSRKSKKNQTKNKVNFTSQLNSLLLTCWSAD